MKTNLLTYIILLYTGVLSGQKDHLFGEIQKIIKNEEDVDLSSASGTMIAVLDWDSTYTYSIGTLSKESNIPVSDTTIFQVGGLSHAQLTMLAYQMFELGLISQSDSLKKFKIAPFKDSWINDLTIGQLMSHTSGLPKILPALTPFKSDPDDSYINIPADTIDKYLAIWSKVNTANKLSTHSQYNYYLLGKILWMVTDTRVHKEGSFIPEMKNTFYKDVEDYKNSEIPTLYTAQARMVGFEHLNGFMLAMGLLTDLHDLMILSQVYLRLSGKDDFKKFALEINANDKKNKKESFSSGGFRWVKTKKSGNLYFMTGVMKGCSAFLGFVPQTQTCVIILSNSGQSIHSLGMHILRMINYQFTRTY